MLDLVKAVFAAISAVRHLDSEGKAIPYTESEVVKMAKNGSVYTAQAKIDGQELQLTLSGRRMQVVNKAAGRVIRVLQLLNPTSEKARTKLDFLEDSELGTLQDETDPNAQLSLWLGDMEPEHSSCVFLVAKVKGKDEAYIQKFQEPVAVEDY